MSQQGPRHVGSGDEPILDVVDITERSVSVVDAVDHAEVLAHLRDAVMLVDAAGIVSYASPNTGRVLGRSAEAWIGTMLVDGFAEPDLGAVERSLVRFADAPLDQGSLLLGGPEGPITLFVDVPIGLGPPGTRLLTFRRSRLDADRAVGSVPPISVAGYDASAARRLAAAIPADELMVHYQPEIDLETGMVIGAEALVRWQHPERGVVIAGEFVGLAESADLIIDMGRFVIGRACAEFGGWARRFGGTGLVLRLNLSAAQLGDDGVVAVVTEALEIAGLAPANLCVEVTESALMADEAALDVLHEMRRLGIEVAVDDFGTGFSSLSQLRRLPVDVLKIDRSFVAGLGLSSDDTAITRAIIELARAMGLGVVAEGIEHPRQVDELLRLGCRRGQGWLYARALPWHTLEREHLMV